VVLLVGIALIFVELTASAARTWADALPDVFEEGSVARRCLERLGHRPL